MRKFFIIPVVAFLLAAAAMPVPAAVLSVRHHVTVDLSPATHTLMGSDVMRLRLEDHESMALFIAPTAGLDKVLVNGREAEYRLEGGRLRIPLPLEAQNGEVVVSIDYHARFDDRFEPEPYAMDNPGQGVTGTMTRDAVFLLGGSGWYPLTRARESSMSLVVHAPAGIFAVTGGRAEAHETVGDVSISRWEIPHAAEPQALFAGKYHVSHKAAGDVQLSTYFLDKTAHLSGRYLDAAERHLAFFQDLHGKYMFPKFAVVENFFPTGYGFPSFTLLGSRVLALPFIPDTSLRHEIAHCWWGNGVLVDFDGGNWSEGLTSYVSEHQSKELESPEAGRQYRLRELTDYALLASGDRDMPLSRFMSRFSPASQAVGYGKAMFVFHMIRRRIGDESFWAALADVYERFGFRRASWEDMRKAFVAASDWPGYEAEAFFTQWIQRPGAPGLTLGNVQSSRDGGGWLTTATLGQGRPFYDLHVPVAVETAAGAVTQVVRLSDASAKVEVRTAAKPKSLEVDPEAHVFRLLSGAEIPPTVNSIKGSRSLIAVISAEIDQAYEPVFRGLLAGLNHPGARMTPEAELEPGDLAGRDVIFFGAPATEAGKSITMPRGVAISQGRFKAGEEVSSESADSAFIAFKDPADQARIKAFFVFEPGLSVEAVERTARKITHYGNYGLLAFSQSRNIAKGALQAGASPLRVNLED